MKVSSLDRFGVSLWRLIALGIAVSIIVSLSLGVAVGGVLGGAGPTIIAVLTLILFYAVVTTPRRILDGQRLSQARDSVFIGAVSKAFLSVIGSRCRTLLNLSPRDKTLAAAMKNANRLILLGYSVEDAIDTASGSVVSYSAASALGNIAKQSIGTIDSGGEETKGLEDSADLSRETKIPMFMTACFFAPILMTLYAVFAHFYDPQSVAELAALEFVFVDLAYHLSAQERRLR